MKKFIAVLLTALLLLAAGCAAGSGDSVISNEEELLQRRREVSAVSDEVMEITEKLFTQQINFIYYNPNDHIGQTVRYEGIFDYYTMQDTGEEFSYVFRYGPGCCANDANVGFEVYWADGSPMNAQINDWVRVTGTIQYIYHGGIQYLAMELSELEVMDERGAETVT